MKIKFTKSYKPSPRSHSHLTK